MVTIIIPIYNEEKNIPLLYQELSRALINLPNYDFEIIFVNDGSQDKTFLKAQEILGANVFRHKINRGKGAATKTGIEAAKMLGAEIIVTMDGDGQHDPQDIQKLIQPILEKKCEVVLGSRLINPEGMPWYKRIHNLIANILVWYLFGLWVNDSQSGFRAYSRHAVEVINTRCDRYEYDSEVIREIYIYKLKFQEVPIQVRYTEYSMSKVQKQSFLNGLKTLYKMFWKLVN